jgi:hypothetical protein
VTRLGGILFAALLAASVVVAAVVVHARTPDLEIQVTHFDDEISPNGHGAPRVAHVRFFVRESEAHATVEIVGPNLAVARILYTGPLAANRPVSYTWNGRTGSGAPVDPADLYRLRVILPSRDRDMVYPRHIAIVEAGRR